MRNSKRRRGKGGEEYQVGLLEGQETKKGALTPKSLNLVCSLFWVSPYFEGLIYGSPLNIFFILLLFSADNEHIRKVKIKYFPKM